MKHLMFFMAPLLFLAWSRGAEGDDTLQYFMAKSEIIVAGRVMSEPISLHNELGVVNYICDFEVSAVIKGDPKVGQKLRVKIIRFEGGAEDRLPSLHKEFRCILFLKSRNPEKKLDVESVDPWFGIQPYNSMMVRALKRLAEEEKKN